MFLNKYFILIAVVLTLLFLNAITTYGAGDNVFKLNNGEAIILMKNSEMVIETMDLDKEVKVSQFIELLVRLLEAPLPDSNTKKEPYCQYIEAAITKGWLLQGDFSEQEYSQLITKAQVARILVRVLASRGEDNFPDTLDFYKNNFNNIDKVDDESALYILKAYVKGILVAGSARDFDPCSTITKREATQMISRIINSQERNYPMWIAPDHQHELMIKQFKPPQGVYFSHEQLDTGLTILNTGHKEKEVWIGLSFQDKQSIWHDVPAELVVLVPGEPVTHNMKWKVPQNILSGNYKVVLAVWDKSPSQSAKRLAHGELENSLIIYRKQECFNVFNETIWSKSNINLGRGSLRCKNVLIQNGILNIHIPPNSFDGGEFYMKNMQSYGAYEIRMKLPDAPSSITGFFLYKAPDYFHEIDIEIYNQSDGAYWLTTYAEGKKTNLFIGKFSFDPTEDFHNYRIEYSPAKLEFYVDNMLIKRWTDGYPKEPMHLMVNCWYPEWLDSKVVKSSQYLNVDWVRY